MNFQGLLDGHWRRGADVTVCVIPKSEENGVHVWSAQAWLQDGQIETVPQRNPKAMPCTQMMTDLPASLGFFSRTPQKRLRILGLDGYLHVQAKRACGLPG